MLPFGICVIRNHLNVEMYDGKTIFVYAVVPVSVADSS